jgi:hypothetical protein
MGMKLSPPDLDLYRAVDEVLHYLWDPIGISSIPEARDEYHGYLPHVFGMVRGGSDGATIAAYLGEVVTNRMGLSANKTHDQNIAQVLLAWRSAIASKPA